jgi:hypothetical protein
MTIMQNADLKPHTGQDINTQKKKQKTKTTVVHYSKYFVTYYNTRVLFKKNNKFNANKLIGPANRMHITAPVIIFLSQNEN